jgi:hypothetical protein
MKKTVNRSISPLSSTRAGLKGWEMSEKVVNGEADNNYNHRALNVKTA